MSALAPTAETMSLKTNQISETTSQHPPAETQLRSALHDIQKMAEELKKDAKELTRDFIDAAAVDFKNKAKGLAKEFEVRKELHRNMKDIPELNPEESSALFETMFGQSGENTLPPLRDTKKLPEFILNKMHQEPGSFATNRERDHSNPDSLSWFEGFAKSAPGKDLFVNISIQDSVTSLSIRAVGKLPGSLDEFNDSESSTDGPRIKFFLDSKGQLVRAAFVTADGKEALIPKAHHDKLAICLAQMSPNKQLNGQLTHEENARFWATKGLQELDSFENAGATVDHVVRGQSSQLSVTINGKTFTSHGGADTPRSELWQQIKRQKDFPQN